MEAPAIKEITVVGRTASGMDIRAAVTRVARHFVVFEIYAANCLLRTSEVLEEFKIVSNNEAIYSGRGVVSNLVNMGAVILCEVALKDGWIDVRSVLPGEGNQLRAEFDEFVRHWQKNYKVLPEFKLVVADMQSLLTDLRLWLEQVELGIMAQPADRRQEVEYGVISELQKPVLPMLETQFERFEEACRRIEPDLQPAHRAYVQRQLHPLLLSSPFFLRTFQKPLGYAGDYEMVNMIVRDPREGDSLFAKLVNLWFLAQPPAEAHRNRIQYLADRLSETTARAMNEGRKARVLSLGCGPAGEVQKFLRDRHFSSEAEFTLLDFNEETLNHTRSVLDKIKRSQGRTTTLHLVKKSVIQILKETGGKRAATAAGSYDFVYCAGLFDYFSDAFCHRLTNILYDWVKPGGLLATTNVDKSNPRRPTMEYIMEWNLIYRSGAELAALKPDAAPVENCKVQADLTGVNVYFEARKPLP